MPRFLATTNIPGYCPMDDDPPVFDTAQEAWAYLAKLRERDEDSADYGDADTGEYSETVITLRYIASADHEHGSPHEDWPTSPDGSGVVYGDTPGYDGDHDLGLAYVVSVV